MTAITPLQSIHKKGLFGDHHKKNENDLLKITEVKDLTIVQVVQFKNSKINLGSLTIDELKLSSQSSQLLSKKYTTILWNAPNIWLVMSKKEKIINIIKENCNNENFGTTDISHSRAIIQITGPNAKEVLKKGCPINFSEFKTNNCAGTIFHGINVIIDCVADDVKT